MANSPKVSVVWQSRAFCWRFALAYLTFLVIASTAVIPARANDTAPEAWVEIPLLDDARVKVRLRVRRVAHAADRDWMRFRFTIPEGGLELDGAAYSVNAIHVTESKLKRGWSGTLGSGSTSDMFKRPYRLPKGISEVSLHPSDDSAMRLGLPPEGTQLEVSASVSLTLQFAGAQIRVPEGRAVPFKFIWTRPLPRQMDMMRAELREMLLKPSGEAHDLARLRMMMAENDLTSGLTVQAVLRALDRRTNDSGRDIIFSHLSHRWSADPAVIDYYSNALRMKDKHAAWDLAYRSSAIWSGSFVELLVVMLESIVERKDVQIGDMWLPLTALARNDADWPKGHHASRLSKALRRVYPVLDQIDPRKVPADEWRDWCDATEFVALTRDIAMVANLRPYLDAQAEVNDFNGPEYDYRRIAPFRACDQAHNVILALLGRPAKEMIPIRPIDATETKAQQLSRRDAAIAKLQKQLSEAAEKGAKP